MKTPCAEHPSTSTASTELRLTRRGKAVVAITGLIAGGLIVPDVYSAIAHNEPEFHGSHKVTLNTGETLWGIANDEVEHGQSHTGDVVEEIIKRNPDVFQDGSAAIEPDDLGKTIIVPDEVEN